ncbi:MAG: PaaX family transcriptional regulator C-terminal domain-containing protein [Acidimicrobiales bacterium]
MTSTRNTLPVDRRRMTARSVIASTLLGLRPPELQTGALVAGAELLGVPPGTARVAISRMVAAGELEPTGDGYRLVGRLLERQARQEVSVQGALPTWDGTWWTAIVPGEARAASDRVELRRAMAALRFGELREGAWLRPANLASGALPWAEEAVAASTVLVTGLVDDGIGLAARLWPLEGWATGATSLLAELAPLQARLDEDDADALAEAFVVAAAVLRHLQADPLLPAALLPARWPGTELRSAQERFDRSFRRVLRAWHLARR